MGRKGLGSCREAPICLLCAHAEQASRQIWLLTAPLSQDVAKWVAQRSSWGVSAEKSMICAHSLTLGYRQSSAIFHRFGVLARQLSCLSPRSLARGAATILWANRNTPPHTTQSTTVRHPSTSSLAAISPIPLRFPHTVPSCCGRCPAAGAGGGGHAQEGAGCWTDPRAEAERGKCRTDSPPPPAARVCACGCHEPRLLRCPPSTVPA